MLLQGFLQCYYKDFFNVITKIFTMLEGFVQCYKDFYNVRRIFALLEGFLQC